MSLDVYLYVPIERPAEPTERIYVRRDGATMEITRAQWDELHPGREPVTVLADIGDEVFTGNITHNLGKMAAHVPLRGGQDFGFEDLYDVLWKPEENGITHARHLIEPLREGVSFLLANRERLEVFNPKNGWGSYDLLVRFASNYLYACEEWPEAEVEASR